LSRLRFTSAISFGSFAVGFSFGYFAWDGLMVTAPAESPPRSPLPLFVVLLIGRFGDLDDHLTTIKLRSVKLFDDFFCRLGAGEGNESIAS
jgi:hypothetical protein